jgi:antitoxin component YwqK of YwqJK toxin-antitoxin module
MRKNKFKMKQISFLFLLMVPSVFAFGQNLEFNEGHYYKNGMLFTGTDTEHFENGNIKVKRNIKNGHEDGLAMYYWDNGKPKEQRSYADGLKNGLWINWNENGIKIAEARYLIDKKDGDWFIWDNDGRKRYEMHYNAGNKTGTWLMWDENGMLIDERKY